MHKIKPDKLTAGTVNSNFEGTIERFVARANGVQSKEHQHTGNRFYIMH